MKKTLLLMMLVICFFTNGYAQTCSYTDVSWLVYPNLPGPSGPNWKTTDNTGFSNAEVASTTLPSQLSHHNVAGRYPGINLSNFIWKNSRNFTKSLFFKKIIHNSCSGNDSISSITLRLSSDDQVDNVWFNGVSVLATPITSWTNIDTITIPPALIRRGDNYICVEASDLNTVACWMLAEVCIAPHAFECCIHPCFNLPDTICEGSPIIPDLTCMQQDVESYRWVVLEEDGSSWRTDTVTGYLSGPVVPMDMNTLWHFEPCKRYYISIDVFKKCSETVINASTNRSFYYAPTPKGFIMHPAMLSCEENCVTLNAVQSSVAPCEVSCSFQWSGESGTYVGHPITVCPLSFPATYTVELRNNFGCTSHISTTVTKDTCCLNPCFALPDTICEGSPIIPNLDCMQQNISSYRWVILEEGSPSWITDTFTNYLSGQVTPMNMASIWSFKPCKRYYVSIDVFKTCGDRTISASTYRSFYIAPRPKATVSEEIMLGCTENCATLNATLLPPAACQTSTSVQWKNGSTLYVGNPVTVCPTSFPMSYSVELRNNFGCTKHYVTTVRKDTCCLNPCFNLPDTICEGDPLFPDLSCMQTNINSYRWVIHRMNPPAPWTPICSTAYLTGPVVPIDFNMMCTLTPGYSYGISVDVFKDCANGTINSSTYREVYVKHKPIQNYSTTIPIGTTINLDLISIEVSGCPGELLYVEDLSTGIKYYPPSLNFTTTGAHELIFHYECCILDYHIYPPVEAFYIPGSDIISHASSENSSDVYQTGSKKKGLVEMTTVEGYLSQNTPNPFSSTTQIKYRLPKGTQKAAIGIYDINGKQVKLFQLGQNINGAIMIHASGLNAGVYLYALIIDGRVLETKRLIITP